MSNSKPIKAMLFSAAVCGFSLWATPAHAGDFYHWSHPLTAWEDGDAQALGYGDMSVRDHTWLHNTTHHRDPRSGGDAAFHVTDYSLEVYNYNEGWRWLNWFAEDQSARTTDWRWYDQEDYQDYTMYNANRGRIRAKVCEDQSHSPDPCSSRPYQTFNL